MKLAKDQQNYMQIYCKEFQTDRGGASTVRRTVQPHSRNTNIFGRLLYRILSNLDDKFTARGQNSVRPLSKVWLWPHPLDTKQESPHRQ